MVAKSRCAAISYLKTKSSSMKSALLPILTLSIAISLTGTTLAVQKPQAHAPARPPQKPKATPDPQKTNSSETKIESVSADSITVKTATASHTYKIDSRTTISVNNKKGTAQDLKTGMRADVSASTIHPDLAVSIRASDAPAK